MKERRSMIQEKQFNLIDEPWIKVLEKNMNVKEVSLKDVFGHANEYVKLANEMPTVDVSILRLLLAITITVFYRYDENGKYNELSEENDTEKSDVLERWKKYWDKGFFPGEIFNSYLEKYRERFYLFHPETPFYQVPDLQYGTPYEIKSLLGNLKESNNAATKHHFSVSECESISKAEAARWLLHLNGYSVNIKKCSDMPVTSGAAGAGRLSKQGIIVVEGDNLFQVLMLNITVLRDGEEIWELPKPAWEQELRTDQGHEITAPNNLPEAYTIQSRRITLTQDKGQVNGFRAIWGDYCTLENAFYEQMTLWQEKKDKKNNNETNYMPKTFLPEVQAWREFPTMFNFKKETRVPGICRWVKALSDNKCISKEKMVTFQTIGLAFGDGMCYTYGNCISDSITLSIAFLNNLNGIWNNRITDEVSKCEAVANTLFYYFADDIVKLFYGKNDNKKAQIKDYLSSTFYARINYPFRSWIQQINPEKTEVEKKIQEWEETAYNLARQNVEEYVSTISNKVFEAKQDGNNTLSVPNIFNKYIWELGKIYTNVISKRGGQIEQKERT